MKIGDKVRFLNDVGGGVVTGFSGKNLVMVENEDGFDIPVPIREVVVVDADDYNIVKPAKANTETPAGEVEEREIEPAEKPLTYKPMPMERAGAEVVNLYLCAVPVSPLQMTESDMELYIVNDCNYFVDFTLLNGENNAWSVMFRGTVEPNMKMYLNTIDRQDLNKLENLCVQAICYKQGKTFMLKPALTVRLKPDLSKFFKLHTFQPNDFFDEKVQTWDVVRDDKPVRGALVDM